MVEEAINKDNNYIIKVENLYKTYGNITAINKISFNVNKGEVFGMLGPNGVGKSTIFNLITGLKDPNFGEIIIDGTNSTKLPMNERFTKFKLETLRDYNSGIAHING